MKLTMAIGIILALVTTPALFYILRATYKKVVWEYRIYSLNHRSQS